MDWTTIASWIAILLGGGMLGAWLLHKRETEKNAVSGYHSLSEDAMALMREIKAENADLRDQLRGVVTEGETQRARIRELEESVDELRHMLEAERVDRERERRRWERQRRAYIERLCAQGRADEAEVIEAEGD